MIAESSCQLNDPEPVVPVHTLLERMGIRSGGDHVTVAKELTDPTQKMSLVCPELHLENHVHILVNFPPSHGEPIVVVLTITDCSHFPMSFVIRCR